MAIQEAEHDAEAYQKGSQEISEQESTWRLFTALAKWCALGMAVLIFWLTLWFMPNGGFFGASVSAIVLGVAGWWYLRSKPAAH